EPDLTGHAMNWGSAGWSNAVRMVDAQLARIIDAIDANTRLTNQTALIVTADHGGGGVMRNGHTEAYHVTNYTVPFFLRAPRIPGGVDLYTLFSNRGDPGTNRTDYMKQPQPIRNGDSSNLALALVGLPPIPGSFMVPVLATRGAPLHIARLNNTMTVFWSDPDDEYELQTATEIRSTDWQTITEGISVNDTTRTYSIGGPTGVPIRFFRLLKRS